MWGWLDLCQHLIFFIPALGGTRCWQKLVFCHTECLANAIVYGITPQIAQISVVGNFFIRPPSPLLWFCSSQWESSSWLLCSTMSNSSGTSTRRLLDNTPTKIWYWKKRWKWSKGNFKRVHLSNLRWLFVWFGVWCICHQAILSSVWSLVCG